MSSFYHIRLASDTSSPDLQAFEVLLLEGMEGAEQVIHQHVRRDCEKQ